MTTDNDTIVNNTETTETAIPRSVSSLLHILATDETYQGMTDEEIQSIVDYEKHLSYIKGQNEQVIAEMANHCNLLQSQTATALQAQESMLQSIIDRASNLQLQVVQHG